MPGTRSESHFEADPVSAPVPGALVVFSHQSALYRPVVVRPSERLVLGRGDVGGAPVPDDRVSEAHTALSFNDGRFVVEDLKSRNKTRVDGVELTGVRLVAPGAVVRMGATLLLLVEDLRRFLTGHVAVDDFVIGPTLKQAIDRAVVARHADRHLLVRGETGAGKDLIAHRYHEAAEPRGPLKTLNCANANAQPSEVQLFGSRRGAFTGAVDREGLLREAHGGVLFLDEIAELSLETQARLLRAIEYGEVTRLGDTTTTTVNVRVVAASHRDLKAEVEAGRFRADLFFRLRQAELVLPPLRERREELPWLAQRALKRGLPLHHSLVEALLLRPWPGNIRELLMEVESAESEAVLAHETVVRDRHLAPDAGLPLTPVTTPAPKATHRPATADEWRAVWEAHGRNASAVARALEQHVTQVRRELTRAGVLTPRTPGGE